MLNKIFSRRNKIAILFGFIFTAIFLFLGDFVSAQVNTGINYMANTGLVNVDPRIVIARVIKIFLGFLGVIAVVLIMYAGFTWMTSEGDPSKLQKAKDILKNSVIGLIIILASYAIVSFIFSMFTGPNSPGVGPGGRPPGFEGGRGSIGACIVEMVYPEPGQTDVPRNTAIFVTFKEPMNNDTVVNPGTGLITTASGDYAVKIYKSNDTTSVLSNVSVATSSDSKTFVFIPGDYLGNSSAPQYYTVVLTNDIETATGKKAFDGCRSGSMYQWDFEVSTKIDLEPPRVKEGGVFPATDNFADTPAGILPTQAYGTTTVTMNPNVYSPATTTSANTIIGSADIIPGTLRVDSNSDKSGLLTVTVQSDGLTATLTKGGTLLGSAIFSGTSISFSDLSFELNSTPSAGNQWGINVNPKVDADTLTIGSITYVFVDGTPTLPNQIQRGSTFNNTASNIATKLSSHSSVELSSLIASSVGIRAKIAGEAGNNIVINSSNPGIVIIPMQGGSNGDNATNIYDRKDKPRNATIQVNFNEAINPLSISGDADLVSNTIRVVNNALGANSNGGGCLTGTEDDNNRCSSFNCSTGSCVGDYLAGSFKVSNIYRTVEFISDDLCGVNGCGENIYCLPENANIKVELTATLLEGNSVDCSIKSPYTNDVGTNCQNSDGINHPKSLLPLTSGVLDAALNSFDGDRDENAEGPGSPSFDFYDENLLFAQCIGTVNNKKSCNLSNATTVCGSVPNCEYSNGVPVIEQDARIEAMGLSTFDDNFTWSFFTSDKIDSTPPSITGITPTHGMSNVNLSNPIVMDFSKVMMSSSLKTGEVKTSNGKEEVTHKVLNLWAVGNYGVGYWASKDNVDISSPLDGEADLTKVYINHSLFPDANSFRSQVGSGIKDIYQNCFKPVSVSDYYGTSDCIGTDANSSCCPTSSTTINAIGTLNTEGNCSPY